MPSKSQKRGAASDVGTRGRCSAVRQAVYAVFDDLRRDRGPAHPAYPFVATLSGVQRSDRSGVVKSYVQSRAVSDAMERGLFPAGRPKSDVTLNQDLVVDICVTELLKRMPTNFAAEALFQPGLFLSGTLSLVRPGTTELVLLDDFDGLLQQALDTHGDAGNLGVAIGIEVAKGYARLVGTPVVHVGSPNYRKALSEDTYFCDMWRWEVDVFRIGDDRANDAYVFDRYRSLGLLNVDPGNVQAKPDPETGLMPGVVFDSGGRRVGFVSPPALAEAVKSCGPGAIGFAIDIRQEVAFGALLHFEPTANPTGRERLISSQRMN